MIRRRSKEAVGRQFSCGTANQFGTGSEHPKMADRYEIFAEIHSFSFRLGYAVYLGKV